MKDSVGTKDYVSVDKGTASAASHPCPKCGRESKEHHPIVEGEGDDRIELARRICAMPLCRYEGMAEEFVAGRSFAAN